MIVLVESVVFVFEGHFRFLLCSGLDEKWIGSIFPYCLTGIDQGNPKKKLRILKTPFVPPNIFPLPNRQMHFEFPILYSIVIFFQHHLYVSCCFDPICIHLFFQTLYDCRKRFAFIRDLDFYTPFELVLSSSIGPFRRRLCHFL